MPEQLKQTNVDREKSWQKFRERFIQEVPPGTIVKNTNLFLGQTGINFVAMTADGGIYEDQNSHTVNVVHINGTDDDGQWSAEFCKRR